VTVRGHDFVVNILPCAMQIRVGHAHNYVAVVKEYVLPFFFTDVKIDHRLRWVLLYMSCLLRATPRD
jgi:hypothetical protein